MSVTFRYKKTIWLGNEERYVPMIPITLIGKEESFDTFGLLDSGADLSVLPKEVAEIIGVPIDEKTKELIRGVSGNSNGFRSNISASINLDMKELI